MDETVEDFEPVYGQARGDTVGRNGAATHLPFLFSLVPTDLLHLCLCITDFHDQTWRAEFSVDQLQDLRDEVGIGGSWREFLVYLRAALVSDNVKLVFGGPASAVDGHGATSASVVAQKMKGTPRLSLPVTKLDGSHVQDAMASTALGLFRSYNAQSSIISAEKTRASIMATSLSAEKAKVEKLNEQIDASGVSYTGRKRSHRDRSAQLYSTPSGSQQATAPLTQFETQDILRLSLTPPTNTLEQTKDAPAVKPPGTKSKAHAAPASRRAKRRGTAISEQPN